MTKLFKFFIPLIAGLSIAQVADAGSDTYTGSGRVIRNEMTMNLGNGQMVYSANSEGVATISTEPPALLRVKCMGLGRTVEQSGSDTDIYCTFRLDAENAFDVKAKATAKGGTANVIGGSGKWSGATGTVTFVQTSAADTAGSFTYKMTITTP